jgi:hypothetical protein
VLDYEPEVASLQAEVRLELRLFYDRSFSGDDGRASSLRRSSISDLKFELKARFARANGSGAVLHQKTTAYAAWGWRGCKDGARRAYLPRDGSYGQRARSCVAPQKNKSLRCELRSWPSREWGS